MTNPLKMLKSWLSRSPSPRPPAAPPAPVPAGTSLAVRPSFRSDLSGDGGEEDGDSVISEKEWDIQERTRERADAMQESRDEGFVIQEHTGSGLGDGAREGASLDWDIATSDSMESANDKLSEQKVAWLERGAHHMGSSSTPLLPSPEDARFVACGRLIRDSGCEWIESMVSDGTIRPKVESGSRMTLEVVPLGVSVLVEFTFVPPHVSVRFSSGEREFADVKELEAWLRSSISAA